jgi:hypothetical protein
MQQGLTKDFQDRFLEKFPLKINIRRLTLKVTYQELMRIKNTPGARHARVVKSGMFGTAPAVIPA